jgi:hypothetical protein
LLPESEVASDVKAGEVKFNLSNKGDEVIKREQKILAYLAKKQEERYAYVRLGEMLDVAGLKNPNMLITSLSRLQGRGVITKPGKGKYSPGVNLPQYLLTLEHEINARKI